jgi:RHS repeat-associated protein
VGTLHYVNDPNGCPTRLIDGKGQVLWAASYSAWGAIDKLHASTVNNPIRLQGQYEDGETEFYYNRHRYYDNTSGAYISTDPIGLMAGENNHSYSPNTFGYVDPEGLNGCKFDPKQIHYMQSSIKNSTGAHTVLENASALRKGSLKASDLPPIKVWQDKSGKIWTLDHRRLAAFKLAKMEEIPVEWASSQEVRDQMWKMTTKTEGKSIRLKIGDGTSQII